MRRRWTGWLLGTALAATLGAGLGWWVLITPSNPLTGLFRAAPTAASAGVIIGPYPLPAELERLEAQGVRTLVSLLDPRIPYERVLLEREREAAARHGMTVVNHPIASVLGHRLDPDPEALIAAAADTVAALDGRVYVHCYLGIHRAQAVADLVAARGKGAKRWIARAGERTESARRLDRAQVAFRSGDVETAARELAALEDPDVDALVLHGWVRLRLNDLDGARAQFEAALARSPGIADAEVGLGYVALRTNDLDVAEPHFARAVAIEPAHADARVGLGLVRFRQGRHEQAATFMRAALEIDPDHADARNTLARLDPPG